MSEIKWIKITTDIFDDEKMYAIETMPDGQLMELIWFKLLCLAGKCNNHGFLMISNKIAYTDEMLSKIFRIELGSVQRALLLFQNLEMIEVVENAYMVSNWDIHQNINGLEDMKKSHADAQKRYRDKQKLLKNSNSISSSNGDITSDITGDITSDIIPSYSYSISNIIKYLNNKCNKEYRSNSKNTIKHITARLKEGYEEESFYTVIDFKASQWLGTEMEQYLRPDTLFGTKFESYLNSAPKRENNTTPKKETAKDDAPIMNLWDEA